MKKADPILRAFGFSLKRLREAKHLTQEELAEKAGIDRTYLSDTERGSRNIGVKNVVRLANALGVPTGELFGGKKP